jgi:hypothetical protein
VPWWNAPSWPSPLRCGGNNLNGGSLREKRRTGAATGLRHRLVRLDLGLGDVAAGERLRTIELVIWQKKLRPSNVIKPIRQEVTPRCCPCMEEAHPAD